MATGTEFADALAAGPLAYALRRPIVLTTPDDLHPEARQTLLERGLTQVVVVGGTAAVSARVEEQVEEVCFESSDPNNPEGPCVEVIGRIGGRDRTETAALLAEEMVTWLQAPPVHVNLARGDDFADAAAGGPHGGFEQAPILLTTDSDTLSDATRRWLEEHRDTIETIDVLGTSDAVSDGVVQEARSAATAP